MARFQMHVCGINKFSWWLPCAAAARFFYLLFVRAITSHIHTHKHTHRSVPGDSRGLFLPTTVKQNDNNKNRKYINIYVSMDMRNDPPG